MPDPDVSEDTPSLTRRELLVAGVKNLVATALIGVSPAPARAQDEVAALIARGHECTKAGKLAEAEQAFRRAYDLGNRSEEVLECLSLTLQRQGRFEEAWPLVAECYRRYPGSPFTWCHVIGCAAGCGYIQYAKERMRVAEKNRADWGPAAPSLEVIRQGLLSREIQVAWSSCGFCQIPPTDPKGRSAFGRATAGPSPALQSPCCERRASRRSSVGAPAPAGFPLPAGCAKMRCSGRPGAASGVEL